MGSIAIIGMAGRFPGARSVAEFWQNQIDGVESIAHFTVDELEPSEQALAAEPNYVRARGVLAGVDLFDASFFSMLPKEAERTDPQQRLFLECCWETLESAGYDPATYPGAIGVFAGTSYSSYFLSRICEQPGFRRQYTGAFQTGNYPEMVGNHPDFLATRVAYKLNLRGPCFTLAAGCSTSLIAVCQAAQTLLAGQADMVLAGAASITLPQQRGYLYQAGGMGSADGHCRTFDAEAAGTVFGGGVAAVLLKRLDDAVRDGDTIHAVLRGFALNNDGSAKIGYTAPAVEGQAEVVAAAHRHAGIAASSIGYVEAHGTATPLGDPIELAALARAFAVDPESSAAKTCVLGTVKPNVGHLDVAAGITGLIHATHVVREGMLPPTLHFARPTERFDWAANPFRVNTALSPWETQNGPRRAGVSAFGVGGTNAHVVIEQAPDLARDRPRAAEGAERPAQLLVLSARTPEALAASRTRLAAHLRAHPGCDLGDVAWTLQAGRRAFAYRTTIVAGSVAEAIAALDAPGASSAKTPADAPALCFLFPGQGAQQPGMGESLYRTEPVFRQAVDECAALLAPELGLDLREVLYPSERTPEAEHRLMQTSLAQPAIFVTEYALAVLWRSWGIAPTSMVGHSVGEYVAATLAGVFTLADALHLIAVRGRLMQALAPGAMLSVRLPEAELLPLLDGVSLAAVNAPSLCVAAGTLDAIAALEARLTERDVAHRRLHTSHAFHSSMMDPILAPFTEAARGVGLHAPKIPFVSSVSGQWITDAEATDPGYWARHFREPVRFADALGQLHPGSGGEPRLLVEVGPGTTLATLARQQGRSEWTIVSSVGGPAGAPQAGPATEAVAMQRTLGQLWAAGHTPDWREYHGAARRLRVPLPTYPFERKRFWFELPAAAAASAPPVAQPESAVPATLEAAFDQVEAVSSPPEQALPSLAEATQSTSSGSPESLQTDAPPAPVFDPAPLQETRSMPIPATLSAAAQEASAARLPRLRTELLAMLADLSGLELSEGDAAASFLELGLDSLFLTQVTQSVQRRYAVKITFRQLMSELSSVEALAEHLDAAMPAAAVPAPIAAPAPAAQAQMPAPPTALPAAAALPQPAASASHLAGPPMQQLFQQQLAAMQQLFAQQAAAMAGGAGLAAPAAPAPVAAAASATPAPAAPAMPAAAAAKAPTVALLPDKELKVNARFQPRAKAAEAPLTPTQQAAIAALIDRYSTRTAGSKRATQQQRSVLADPRVVAGFRAQWKEMIYPIVTVRSRGAHLWDVDGNQYVDILNGFGPIMLGHRPQFVQKAIEDQLRLGFETGPQTLLAGEVAQKLCAMTGNERATFCNTGSEAVTAALRIARTVTGRDKVVIFAGDYHGMFDEVLVKGIWKGGEPHTLPAAPGIPRAKCENVVVLEYGTDESLAWIRANAEELAAVMVEPVQSRHPSLQPVEFLREVRAITEQAGTCFIFDEVVTGFRVHPGGCQALFGIRADLATYGKVLAGGMPIGVLAGKRQYMDALDGGQWQYGDDSFPEVGVTFFAGTFVRHPLTMAACRAVLDHLAASGPELQQTLTAKTASLASELNSLFAINGVPAKVEQFASIFYLSISPEVRFASLFFFFLREKGVHLAEGFPCFLTTAHSEADFAWIVRAFTETIAEMQAGELLPAAPGATAFPLTEAQREIWLAAQVSEQASSAFNESFTLRLAGALDEGRLRAAVQQLVARHESLRGAVTPNGEQLRCLPALTLDVPLVDLSALTPAVRAERYQALIANEARTPFDLHAGPLVRMHLVRLSAGEHALVITAHHIICDGWSVNVLVDELSRLYTGETLAPPVSFGDYAVAERAEASKAGSAHQTAEAYWLAQFAEPPTPLDLPLDRARPAVKSYAGATYLARWSAETAKLVRGAGAAQGCTLFVTLLSGFAALLARLSSQQDVTVGVPTAAQSLLDDGAMIGHAVNFLPIRTRLEGQQSFASLLKQTQRTLLDAYDHSTYTYGTLVRALKLKKDVSRLSLIEVQFNLEKLGTGLTFGDLQAKVEPNGKAAVNFDLFLNIVEAPDGLMLDCDYNTDLFDEATIARWLGHYQALLTGAAQKNASELTVDTLPLLSADERRHLLLDMNQTELATRALPAYRLFAEQATRTPKAPAVLTAAGTVSYAELDRNSDRVAAYLDGLGVRTGDMVGIATERGIPMVEALLGIWKVGASYVPLDPAYPQARLDMILAETCVPVLITDSRSADKFRETATHLVLLDRDADAIAAATFDSAIELGDDAQSLDRLAYVIFTSGSTGRPKGVEVTHRNLSNFLQGMQREPGITAGDTLLAVTTLSFDIAALELYLPLITGASVYLPTREVAADARLLRRTLEGESSITIMQATPATWRMLLETGWTGDGRLKMLCGGEALPRELAAQLLPCGGSLWNMYGPTETTVWSAVLPVTSTDKAIPLGRPIANTQLYVVSPTEPTALQPLGVAGELCIGGAGVARGYHKRPDLTAERFLPNPFTGAGRMYRTGDLVRRRADGTLEFLGRLDHQVKVNGFRIELGEIESVLGRQPGVRACIAIARESGDPAKGLNQGQDKRLVAYVVPDGQEPAVATLRHALRQALPEFMVPTLFVFLPALPQTPNGKVDRAQLPAPESHHLQRREPQQPRTPTEQALERICAEVLQLDRVDTSESLFHLGADSIHLFQIIARARAASLSLTHAQVLGMQTIRAMAEAVDQAKVPGTDAEAPQDGRPGAPAYPAPITPVSRDRYRVAIPNEEVRLGSEPA